MQHSLEFERCFSVQGSDSLMLYSAGNLNRATEGFQLSLALYRKDASALLQNQPVLDRPLIAYRPDIDGLRALAILPVVLYHAGIPGFAGGFVGVDVFFVISGYLMASLILAEIQAGRFSLGGFYERRIRRIFPALFAMIAVSGIAAWFGFMPVEFEYFARSAKAAALFFSNIQFEKENSYFDIGSQLKPLLHTWSLAVEEQFYIVFPISMALLAKAGRKSMIAVLVTILIASFAASAWVVQRSPAAGFYLSQYRVWELLLGAILAFNLIAQPARTSVSRWCASLGIGLIAYSVFFFSEATTFPGPAALLPCFGAALIIYSGVSDGISYAILTSRPLVFIGLISYSLYLWHWPLIVFTRYFTGHQLSLSQNALLVVLSIVASTISWRFIERPFRGPDTKVSGMAMFSAGAAAIIVAALFAGFVKTEKGFPERLSGPALKAYSATYDLSRFNSPECFTENQGVGPSVNDVRSGKLCQLGLVGPGPIDFIVWGDSHSAAMAPAIDEAAGKSGMRGLLAGHASCPPLPGVVLSVKNDVDTEHCGDYNAAVRTLIATKRIPLVIMAAYWPKYMHDAELPNEGLYFDSSVPPPLQDHSAPIASAMDKTLQDLGDHGIKTVLVMDVPEMGHFMPEALAKAVATGASTDIAPPWNYVAARQALSRSIIQKLASAHGSAIVDPLPAICPGNHCDAQRDGIALYKDADHITATTARSLGFLYLPLFDSRKG